MAIKVGTTGTTTKQVVVTGSVTTVKKVIVGTPVRKVTSGSFNINNLVGIDVSNAENGDMLIYNGDRSTWVSTKDLDEQNINGGSY